MKSSQEGSGVDNKGCCPSLLSPRDRGKVWHRVRGQHLCLTNSFRLTVEIAGGYSRTQVGDVGATAGGTQEQGDRTGLGPTGEHGRRPRSLAHLMGGVHREPRGELGWRNEWGLHMDGHGTQGVGATPGKTEQEELKTVLRKPIAYRPFWNAGWVSQPLGGLTDDLSASSGSAWHGPLPLEVLLEWLWPMSDRHDVRATQPRALEGPQPPHNHPC